MSGREMMAAGGRRGMAARWGGRRGKSCQVRVDSDAAAALRQVPERDRRRVASDGIAAAVEDYLRQT